MPGIKRVARFDEHGNRLTSTAYKDIGTASADATTYTINDLNQYASRTKARRKDDNQMKQAPLCRARW